MSCPKGASNIVYLRQWRLSTGWAAKNKGPGKPPALPNLKAINSGFEQPVIILIFFHWRHVEIQPVSGADLVFDLQCCAGVFA